MTNRTDVDSAGLRRLLEEHPPERVPLEHATARFHLGTALIEEGAPDEAADHLATAARIFEREGAATERAKATNMLGIAQRDRGDLADAEAAFAIAAQIFDEQGDVAECGAALYNLGLLKRDQGETATATELFSAAAAIFEEAGVTAQVAVARRELGSALLEEGDADGSRRVLSEAVAWARTAGDLAALGHASTMLGLAHLATDRCGDAVAAFRDAVGAHPRTVRPEAHAVAKANLAVALERDGAPARARLAARQALAVDAIPEHAREVAAGVLERHPADAGDLGLVLADEPRDAWEAVVREEVVRWTLLDEEERRAEVAAWISAVRGEPQREQDLLEAWLGALLELPPAAMERLIASTVQVLTELPGDERTSFRRATERAMARFHVPQLMRLRETFDRLAAEHGAERWQ